MLISSLFNDLPQHAVVVKFHRNDRLMRQCRACGIDSFGLGITCIFYHCTMCTSHHDLVSFAFHAIPIYIPILIRRIFTLLVPSHFYTDFITSSDAAGAMLQAAKKDYVLYTPVAKHAVSYMNAKCTYIWELCLQTLCILSSKKLSHVL